MPTPRQDRRPSRTHSRGLPGAGIARVLRTWSGRHPTGHKLQACLDVRPVSTGAWPVSPSELEALLSSPLPRIGAPSPPGLTFTIPHPPQSFFPQAFCHPRVAILHYPRGSETCSNAVCNDLSSPRLAWRGLRLRDGTHLLHRAEQIVLWPFLDHLAASVEAVYLDAAHLDAVARGGDAEELALVGAAGRVAGHHLVAFRHLVIHGVGEVGDGVAEVCDLLFYDVRSPDLSGLGVGVVADEVGIEDILDQLNLALTESLLHQAAGLLLVRVRHVSLLLRALLVHQLRPGYRIGLTPLVAEPVTDVVAGGFVVTAVYPA